MLVKTLGKEGSATKLKSKKNFPERVESLKIANPDGVLSSLMPEGKRLFVEIICGEE